MKTGGKQSKSNINFSNNSENAVISVLVRYCWFSRTQSILLLLLIIIIISVIMSENRVLRRIFGPKRDEVTEECRKLHNEEPHDLYSLQSIIRITKLGRMRWAGHVARMGEKRNTYRLLVGKP
jgi:hypothetical protein